MEKMRFESVDGFQENIRRLADIFPSCVKEQKDNDGKTIRKVDINTLQLLLGINQKESETARCRLMIKHHGPHRKYVLHGLFISKCIVDNLDNGYDYSDLYSEIEHEFELYETI